MESSRHADHGRLGAWRNDMSLDWYVAGPALRLQLIDVPGVVAL
jgi:hypothetical protein